MSDQHTSLDLFFKRPRKRSECLNGPRPCPWVSCPYHLYLDISPLTGSIKFNFKHLVAVVDPVTGEARVSKEPEDIMDLEQTCALDVAANGSHTLQEIGTYMNVTRERIRQIEEMAFKKLKAAEGTDFLEFLDDLKSR